MKKAKLLIGAGLVGLAAIALGQNQTTTTKNHIIAEGIVTTIESSSLDGQISAYIAATKYHLTDGSSLCPPYTEDTLNMLGYQSFHINLPSDKPTEIKEGDQVVITGMHGGGSPHSGSAGCLDLIDNASIYRQPYRGE